MRFAPQQHHDAAKLLRRKAPGTAQPKAMRSKSNSFLALAKLAVKHGPPAPRNPAAVAPAA